MASITLFSKSSSQRMQKPGSGTNQLLYCLFKDLSCNLNYKKKYVALFRVLTFFIITYLLQINVVNAQFTGCTGCVANDDHVDSAVLVQLNPAWTSTNGEPKYVNLPSICTGGTVTGYLKIAFTQQATTRYGTSLKGNILVDGVYSSTFSYCNPAETSSGSFVKYIEDYPITFTCGTQLSLENLFIGWGNSKSQNVCPVINDNVCDATPHCEQLPLNPGDPPIVIVTPLSTDFIATGSCKSSSTAQTYSFDALDAASGTTGGTPPYTFSWSIVNKSTSVEVSTLTGSNPSFDFSQAGAGIGTYTVTLTVTDAALPTHVVDTKSKDITVISCCIQPNAGTDGTLTVCTGTTPTNAQLFEALEGNPSSGGTWSAPVNGVYTYTIAATAPCTEAASATVTVTEAAKPNAGTDGTLTVCTGTTPTNAQLFEALEGNPSSGGTWSDPVNGVYTYTIAATAPCTEAASATVTVTELPNAAPTLGTVQPTCTKSSANITVTSATTGLLFSLDGGAYASYPSGGYTVTTKGAHTITVKNNAGCISNVATVSVQSSPIACAPYYTYTQGYYSNKGQGCTPSNGSLSAGQMVQLSLDNMDGTVNSSGKLYLGKSGASFTALYSEASKLQAIMPGGGKATKLTANFNLSSKYPPLKNGRISNILLSQTITLALNVNIPNNGLGSFVLNEGYLTTMTKSGSSCNAPMATCETGGSMSSMKITNNSKLMALLKGKTVNYLLNLASAALGGSLPQGVSYDDISSAVDVINRSFDEGRYALGYNSTQTSCGSSLIVTSPTQKTESPAPATVETINDITVSAYPNPFTDRVKFSITSSVSGNATLDLYNLMGVKLATIYQGYLFAGNQQVINYKVPAKYKGTLIYVLTIGNQQINGKLIELR
jgi:hypothetical protein